MAIIPLYRDLLTALPLGHMALKRHVLQHRPFYDGLLETYGADFLGGATPATSLGRMAPGLYRQLKLAPSYNFETWAKVQLDRLAPLLPAPVPDLYLGTLLFMAPAATIAVGGRPALVLAMERFHSHPERTEPRFLYAPSEAEEMLPHEAAHAARMAVLRLPPTPMRLSLLDMVMLEGTALTFTDGLVGRQTLATFMPEAELARLRSADADMRQAAAARFGETGMDVFAEFFGPSSPVSGYYVGYSFCREFLDRFGEGTMGELLSLPSEEIIDRLGFEY